MNVGEGERGRGSKGVSETSGVAARGCRKSEVSWRWLCYEYIISSREGEWVVGRGGLSHSIYSFSLKPDAGTCALSGSGATPPCSLPFRLA